MPAADFSRADKNRDNTLDLTEVLEYLHRDLYEPFNQRMVPIFKQLDANASNHLEEAEFARITLSSVGPDGRPMSPTSLMFRVSDRNRDFRVDYDEFEDLMAWDEANMLPEYFRGTPVTNGPIANQPVPQPVVQPVTPQPPRVTPQPQLMPWPPTQPIAYGTQPRSLTTTRPAEKPAASTSKTKRPGGAPAKAKAPSSSVTASRSVPSIVTTAPAITPGSAATRTRPATFTTALSRAAVTRRASSTASTRSRSTASIEKVSV
jgi:hypothetical protein